MQHHGERDTDHLQGSRSSHEEQRQRRGKLEEGAGVGHRLAEHGRRGVVGVRHEHARAEARLETIPGVGDLVATTIYASRTRSRWRRTPDSCRRPTRMRRASARARSPGRASRRCARRSCSPTAAARPRRGRLRAVRERSDRRHVRGRCRECAAGPDRMAPWLPASGKPSDRLVGPVSRKATCADPPQRGGAVPTGLGSAQRP